MKEPRKRLSVMYYYVIDSTLNFPFNVCNALLKPTLFQSFKTGEEVKSA